jgi:hypothetical protein
MKCCICGPVRNCAPYLPKIFENIEKIGSLFEEYVIIMYYDVSKDNTLQILKNYQLKNPNFQFFVNNKPLSKYRTYNISNARNYCINNVRQNYPSFEYFIMMDCDDVNAKNINLDTLRNALKREDWDGLSFNTSPRYYDIWGLSIYPYCFSYNHFKNNVQNYDIIQNYVEKKLKKLRPGDLLPCISAFNGFSIYRTKKFENCYYNGRINLRLIPTRYMLAHMRAAKSKIIFKKYVTVNGFYEDCEHRAFHVNGINKNNARIRISQNVLFA